jgi:nitrogen fixation NifU-like protein
MTFDLRDLYQDLILDHGRRPRNHRRPERVTCAADGHNPLCGDRLTVFLDLDGTKIKDVAFEGNGCAISTASASLMTESLKGRTIDEARSLFTWFHEMLTTPALPSTPPPHGKLAVFAGVREFPVRVKCATLAWHTMMAALEGRPEAISTE